MCDNTNRAKEPDAAMLATLKHTTRTQGHKDLLRILDVNPEDISERLNHA